MHQIQMCLGYAIVALEKVACMTDVVAWLRRLGLEKYADALTANEIDLRALPELTEDDLKELGLPIGPRRIVMKALVTLRSRSEGAIAPVAGGTGVGASASPHDASSRMPSEVAERRQVTIMFCDMVGSSALSTKLDPEEQRDVVSHFQTSCATEVKRFGGIVAQYLGDGVLVYFGYPIAHEDDAERAIRAGLEILGAISSTNHSGPGAPIRARIGIATGIVVVGDLMREGVTQENAAIGETTNLAARLQALAEPNTLLICPETHRLVGVLFDYTDIGQHNLKGFARPVHVRQVTRASNVENRFEARRAEVSSPLLGRDEELELLLRRWEQAKRGDGRMVLVTGEAGIGKSRLTRVLQARLAKDPHIVVICHCSPYHQESALHPMIGQLSRAAEIEADDSPQGKLAKIEALLSLSSENLAHDVPLFAALLSVPVGDRYTPPQLSPQRLKELTLRALIHQMKRLAEKRPVLVLYEDIHWADPTTLELLSLTIEEAPALRLLFIATSRPDFTPRWPSHPHISIISLSRLGHADGQALVEDVTKGKALPSARLLATRGDQEAIKKAAVLTSEALATAYYIVHGYRHFSQKG